MGIEMATSQQEINDYLQHAQELIYKAVLKTLSYLGEECIRRIRQRKDNWIDRTGNLRSSIGYAVLEQGRQKIASTFEQVKDGTQGPKAGKEAINYLATQYATTFALCVVAGMDYAEYVEKMENKDVLESTRLWAEELIDEYINKAIQSALNAL